VAIADIHVQEWLLLLHVREWPLLISMPGLIYVISMPGLIYVPVWLLFPGQPLQLKPIDKPLLLKPANQSLLLKPSDGKFRPFNGGGWGGDKVFTEVRFLLQKKEICVCVCVCVWGGETETEQDDLSCTAPNLSFHLTAQRISPLGASNVWCTLASGGTLSRLDKTCQVPLWNLTSLIRS